MKQYSDVIDVDALQIYTLKLIIKEVITNATSVNFKEIYPKS